MHIVNLLILLLVVAFVGTSCRKEGLDPTAPADVRLARVVWYSKLTGIGQASEDRYEYNSKGQLARINTGHRDSQTNQFTVGKYETYTYESTGQLQAKTLFSRLRDLPFYAGQEWRYSYPSPNKVVETAYLIYPANSPAGAGPPYRTSYSETLLENGLIKTRTYFTKDSLENGTYLYTYRNGQIQQEEFRRNNLVISSTQYTYSGTTVSVESFRPGSTGSVSERRQTLDARGRVIKDEVVKEENFGWEPGMGPNVTIYEYLN